MADPEIHTKPEPFSKALFRDYMMLSKFRLSLSVVGTTMIAYYLGTVKNGLDFEWLKLFGLAVGGMLVVASSNGFNQIYERDTDRMMSRTRNRPVAAGRMDVNDAIVFSAVCGVLGLLTIAYLVNGRAAFISLVSLFIYTLAYTPLKRITPLAVFVGAIPGALPPAIGWIGAVGNIDDMAWILFLIQFFWQFPHFWSIAWMLEDDYRKAGYTLLPNYEGRTKKNASQIIIYTLMLILISMYPVLIKFGSVNSLVLLLPAGFYMLYRAIVLYKTLEVADARKTMYASLLFMPIGLISYLL